MLCCPCVAVSGPPMRVPPKTPYRYLLEDSALPSRCRQCRPIHGFALRPRQCQNQIMDLKAILQSNKNKWSSDAKLLFPDNEVFSDMTERWSIAYPPTFAASITAGNIEDVQAAVCSQPSPSTNTTTIEQLETNQAPGQTRNIQQDPAHGHQRQAWLLQSTRRATGRPANRSEWAGPCRDRRSV